VTRWRVRASAEEVFTVLTDSKSLIEWWPSVYRAVDQIAPPSTPDGVGKRLGLHTQGWLPYRLHWELSVVEHQSPSHLAFETTGDFVGSGRWTLSQDGEATEVKYEWSVRAEKPLLKYLSLLLKPLFAMNHRWAMARGLESLELELERRRGRVVPQPPRPVSAFWSSLVVLGVVGALTAAAFVLFR
jgi:hypothetical protein